MKFTLACIRSLACFLFIPLFLTSCFSLESREEKYTKACVKKLKAQASDQKVKDCVKNKEAAYQKALQEAIEKRRQELQEAEERRYQLLKECRLTYSAIPADIYISYTERCYCGDYLCSEYWTKKQEEEIQRENLIRCKDRYGFAVDYSSSISTNQQGDCFCSSQPCSKYIREKREEERKKRERSVHKQQYKLNQARSKPSKLSQCIRKYKKIAKHISLDGNRCRCNGMSCQVLERNLKKHQNR